MQFSPTAFNALLKGIGQAVTWRRAVLCPCRNPTSGASLPGCPACAGKGVIYEAPVPAWTGVSGQKQQRQWMASTEYQLGDEVVTIGSDSPLYAMGESDRVVMTQSTIPFNDVLTRTGTETIPETGTIASVDRVIWVDPTTHAVVNGALPIPDPSGGLAWASPVLAPPAGIQYTIGGRRNPEYYCFRDLVQDRAHNMGMPLPRRAVLRVYDLAAR